MVGKGCPDQKKKSAYFDVFSPPPTHTLQKKISFPVTIRSVVRDLTFPPLGCKSQYRPCTYKNLGCQKNGAFRKKEKWFIIFVDAAARDSIGGGVCGEWGKLYWRGIVLISPIPP